MDPQNNNSPRCDDHYEIVDNSAEVQGELRNLGFTEDPLVGTLFNELLPTDRLAKFYCTDSQGNRNLVAVYIKPW